MPTWPARDERGNALAALCRATQRDHSSYALVLTRDRAHELRGGESEVGTARPSKATDEMIERARTEGRPWRMLDEGDVDAGQAGVNPDERGVVYEGLIWTAVEPGGEEDFGPLYDFGQPNWGCVEIQYRELR
ncbi:hypothetical protein PSN13_01351 [Micromonospora saelicesensis]|uniref:Uncharacterized protein n=1 Tax=Micromonospora saelicesensis TaxID=285676 RepID=A0A328NVA0_9ACTN|nr:hypothetical protein [Micromonospora saelicesensis]RAO37369.1 hypothetical protein PSN13_01351 [Micromonospora saelicesensis]